MSTATLDFGFEVKSISDSGTFSGYGSVFGVIDTYGDVVAPGAFVDSLNTHRAKGRMPAMLWQHRSAEPIGVYTQMFEDSVGLQVEGTLALTTVRGAEAHTLMKMGALTGLSIGYMTREDAFDKVTGITTLKKVDLWEVSPVTFPANDASRINFVKGVEAIEKMVDLKSAEAFLRESGMSRREATLFIARLKCLMQRESDEGDMQALIEAIKRRQVSLTN